MIDWIDVYNHPYEAVDGFQYGSPEPILCSGQCRFPEMRTVLRAIVIVAGLVFLLAGIGFGGVPIVNELQTNQYVISGGTDSKSEVLTDLWRLEQSIGQVDQPALD